MARYALVIGITQYQSSQMSRLPKAASDAETLAQVLEQYGGFSVKRLPERWNAEKNCFEISGEKALTSAQVGQELINLLLDRATKNEALIYFAGHGFTFSDTLGQAKGVLATSDSQVEMTGNQIIDYKYGISLASLNDLIQKSDLSSLVMLLDCCHSGYFLESQLVQRTLTAFSTQKDYYLMAACRTFETAKSFKGEPNSYFTGAVLRGLASENANRNLRVSGDRLFDYISGELKSFVQEPIRMGWGRCITLVTYPQLETKATEITFDRVNPYQGLNAFEREQKQYFFGRESAVRTLITHLTNSSFLPIIGYSGSGKSSLVKAGLFPELKGDLIPGSSQWPIESFTPGKYPLGKMTDILARQRQQSQPYIIFIDQFEEVFTLCEDETERQAFIHLIAEEINQSECKSRMIIAIRGDFLTRCTDYPEAGNLINRTPPIIHLVMPLLLKELEEAIEKPAELHGVKFERGLVSQISQDVVGQPGTLPLLQYALKELWRVCIELPEFPEPMLTKKGYEEIGGVQGALENRANLIYQSLSDGDRVFVRKLFMELVQLGEGKEVTRRRVDRDRLEVIADSPEQLERVIWLLAGAQQRLIITAEKTVEVVHEALLSRWKLLRDWIEEDREKIRISRRFEVACKEWQETYGKSAQALLMGARLAEVEEWEKKVKPRLTGDEKEFLRESLGRRDRAAQDELEQQRQLRELAEAKAKAEAARAEEEIAKTIAQTERAIAAEDQAKAEAARAREAEARIRVQKQRTRFAIASGLLAAFTLGFGLLANQRELEIKKRELQVEQQKALNVYALINNAKNLLETNNQIEALLASLEALAQLKELGLENPSMLNQLQSIVNGVQEHNRLVHPNQVRVVTFNPKSKEIASATSDGTIWLWSKEGKIQRKISGLSGHKEVVWSLSFSPDGQKLASASGDKTIKIWSATTGELLKTLVGHTASVYDVKFSSDSNNVVSASGDGSVRLWDVKTGELLKKLENKGKLLRLDFSRNSSKVAFIGNDNSVNIWNLQEKDSKIIGKHENVNNSQVRISYVVFNWESNLLASSDYKGFIKLWDVATNQVLMRIDSKKSFIHGLAFSPDSKMIASANGEATIKLWKLGNIHRGVLTKQPEPEIVKGHRDEVVWVNFLPQRGNIKIMASASDDTMIKIWRIGDKVSSSGDVKKILVYGCNSLKDYFNTHEDLSLKEKQINKFCEFYYNN